MLSASARTETGERGVSTVIISSGARNARLLVLFRFLMRPFCLFPFTDPVTKALAEAGHLPVW